MFQILLDKTVGYPTNQLFLSLIETDEKNVVIEISNRKRLFVTIKFATLTRGELIYNEIIPAFQRCATYKEAIDLLRIFHNSSSIREALFLISTHKRIYGFWCIDTASKIYGLKTVIHNGQFIKGDLMWDLGFYIYLKGDKLVGYFAGGFNEKFTFLKN